MKHTGLDIPKTPHRITELDISNLGLTSLPAWLWLCTNLTVLNASRNKITNLVLNHDNITKLNCSHNDIVAFYGKLPKLMELDCSHNKLNSIDLNTYANLTTADISYNNIKNLNNLPDNLISLNCGGNKLTRILLNKNIQHLSCYNNYCMTDLLNGNRLLSLSAWNNMLNWPSLKNIRSLNLSGQNIYDIPNIFDTYPYIVELDISNNKLTHIKLEDLIFLKCLNVNNNNLQTITLAKMPQLNKLYFSNNKIGVWPDLTSCPALTVIWCNSNCLFGIDHLPDSVVELNCADNNITYINSNNKLFKLEASNNMLNEIHTNVSAVIKYLDLSYNNICQVNNLDRLTQLVGINLANNDNLNISGRDRIKLYFKFRTFITDNIHLRSLINEMSGKPNTFIGMREDEYKTMLDMIQQLKNNCSYERFPNTKEFAGMIRDSSLSDLSKYTAMMLLEYNFSITGCDINFKSFFMMIWSVVCFDQDKLAILDRELYGCCILNNIGVYWRILNCIHNHLSYNSIMVEKLLSSRYITTNKNYFVKIFMHHNSFEMREYKDYLICMI